MARATKNWEVFPGRNKFYLDGKIIMGPDVSIFYVNIFLIVVTTIVFFLYEIPTLTTKVSISIPVMAVILFIFVMSALLKTSFTDPGIIPRATPDEAYDIEKQIKNNCGDLPADRPPPRTREVLIRGQVVKLKYCFTCKIFRPPRASHCSLCDNCVDHFDHHCPWVGNCVGRRNYRYFYMFTVSLSIYITFVFTCTIIHLYTLTEESKNIMDAIAESPASLIVLLITFFSCWSVFGLAIFHTYLAITNQTTNEDIKGSFSNKRGGTNRNPYSTGNSCSNYCYVLCGPFTPSLIDREGFITPDFMDKKPMAVRQTSRLSSPLYSSSVYHAHYPMNGAKSFSSLSQSNPTVISGSLPQIGVVGGRHQTMTNSHSANSLRREINFNQNPSSCNKNIIYECIDEKRHPATHNYKKSSSSANNKHGRSNAISLSKIDSYSDDGGAGPSLSNNISMEPLSASKLQLLQDTTMIQSALDLDSIEELTTTSSIGANSHTSLMTRKK